MNKIATSNQQLPDTIPDLAKFVLIGRDKLKAVRAEIHAIDKVGMARDVYKQKLEEAQEIAEVVTDAECRMGELLKEREKPVGNRFRTSSANDTLQDIGITRNQSSQFQIMANHPESVEKAKAKAREEGTVLSRNAVLQQIHADVAPKKSPAQSMKEFMDRKRQEHEDFKEKKTVSIDDIQKDKETTELIVTDLYTRLLRMGKRIDEICFDMEAGDIDLKELGRTLPKDKADFLQITIRDTRNKLLKIEMEVYGDR